MILFLELGSFRLTVNHNPTARYSKNAKTRYVYTVLLTKPYLHIGLCTVRGFDPLDFGLRDFDPLDFAL